MPTRSVLPPYRGVSNCTPYYSIPGDMCPPEAMLNVRCYVPQADRPQVGTRPGLVAAFPQLIANGAPIQAMRTVNRSATVIGLTVGNCTSITDDWESRVADTLTGQVWILRSNLGMVHDYYENTGASGPYADTDVNNPSIQSVTCCCFTPGGSVFVFGSTYTDGSGLTVGRVTAINASTGLVIWSHKVVRASNAYVNSVCATDTYVFVSTNNYVRVLRVTDGAQQGPENDCNRWSSEVIGIALNKVASTSQIRYLSVLYFGSTAAASLSGESVASGKYAQHFRAGVMSMVLDPNTPASTADTVIMQVSVPEVLSSSDTYFEAHHFHCRFSERFEEAPHGTYPTGIDSTPTGGFVVSHTNQGWGNKPAVTPTGYPFRTVSVFDNSGAIVWRADTDSLNLAGDGGRNDIVYDAGGSLFSSIAAVACDTNGDVYAGGRRTAATGNEAAVFKLSKDDGRILWRFDTGHSVTQSVRAMTIDPTDGNLIVVGDRSTTWSGATGFAHLWKLSAIDGSVLAHFDLGVASKSGLGVAVDLNGQVGYTTDKVP